MHRFIEEMVFRNIDAILPLAQGCTGIQLNSTRIMDSDKPKEKEILVGGDLLCASTQRLPSTSDLLVSSINCTKKKCEVDVSKNSFTFARMKLLYSLVSSNMDVTQRTYTKVSK